MILSKPSSSIHIFRHEFLSAEPGDFSFEAYLNVVVGFECTRSIILSGGDTKSWCRYNSLVFLLDVSLQMGVNHSWKSIKLLALLVPNKIENIF